MVEEKSLSHNMIHFKAVSTTSRAFNENERTVRKCSNGSTCCNDGILSVEYHNQFKNVILHLRDFHVTKESFAMTGKIESGLGFEDAVFQPSDTLFSSRCSDLPWTSTPALSFI